MTCHASRVTRNEFMYVKVLYDRESKKGMDSGWGFSCLIDGKILFDTVDTSMSLVRNMDRMMVDLDAIDGVVISHEHWDHTGGLWEILKRKKGLKVYVCPSASETFRKCVEELGGRLVEVSGPMEVAENIFLTGEIGGAYKDEYIGEQAVVVKGEKGGSVITGCAHPGIVKILEFARDKLGAKRIYMVFGGFHLDGKDREAINDIISRLKSMGVEKVGPTHCSGEKARRIFVGQYHDKYIPVRAGHVIHL